LLVPGVGLDINGSTRWLSIAGVRIQPAEVIKLVCIIYIADYYARKKASVHLFKVGVFNLGLPIAILAGLLLMQPDFGTTVVIIAMTGGMMFLAGVKLRVFTLVVLGVIGLLALIAVLEPYRIERLTVYLNPWDDPFDKGFQLTQALMAVGRGGWLGVGLGNSLQKLNYLPHADNDFLIAIIAEELGAVGVMAVMALFGIAVACVCDWRPFATTGTPLWRVSGVRDWFDVGVKCDHPCWREHRHIADQGFNSAIDERRRIQHDYQPCVHRYTFCG